jgi:glucose-1-phosphate thymidylyltransferase
MECEKYMKALIPAAGVGERLRPHTHTKPKALVYVAGKPIIGHILDRLEGAVDEVIIVVGYMKDKLIEYVDMNYSDRLKVRYVEQVRRLGLGHAIYVAEQAVGDEPLLITLGDEFFGVSYKDMITKFESSKPCDAFIGIKEVDDPSNYGIVELQDGKIVSLVEKPKVAKTNLATAGVYIIENCKLLWDCLQELVDVYHRVENNTKLGEIELTDALMRMVQKGATLKSFKIREWYDCGRPEMLLKVNWVLLDRVGTDTEGKHVRTVFIDPVIVGHGCRIKNSILGPHVSVANDTVIMNSVISNSIIGAKTELQNVILRDSIIGDEVTITGKGQKMNVGEHTKIKLY